MRCDGRLEMVEGGLGGWSGEFGGRQLRGLAGGRTQDGEAPSNSNQRQEKLNPPRTRLSVCLERVASSR